MKKALLVPLRFFLLLLLLTILITAYALIEGAAVYTDIGPADGTNRLLYIISGLKSSLYLGGIIAILFSMRSILRLGKYRGVAMLLLFILSSSMMFFGYYAVRQSELNLFGEEAPLVSSLVSGRVINFPIGALYFTELNDGVPPHVLLYHYANFGVDPVRPENDRYSEVDFPEQDARVARLKMLNQTMGREQLLVVPGTDEIQIIGGGVYSEDGATLVIRPDDISNTPEALFNQTGLLSNLRISMGALFTTLDTYASTLSYRYAILIASLLMFTYCTWVFIRLTRWPMINMILAILVNIGGLFLTRIGEIDVVTQVASGFLQERALGYIAPAFLGFFALIFLVMNTFLPSIKTWTNEVDA